MYAKSVKNRDDYIAGLNKQIDLIFDAFKEMLKTTRWITPESREKAYEKRKKFKKNKFFNVNYLFI